MKVRLEDIFNADLVATNNEVRECCQGISILDIQMNYLPYFEAQE